MVYNRNILITTCITKGIYLLTFKTNKMKKIILTLVITLITVLSYSQDTSMAKLPDTAKLTVNKVYDDVKAGLTGVAGALKVGANHVYKILIKQQLVSSIIWCFLFSLSFIMIGNFIKAYNSKEEWWANLGDGYVTWVGIIRVLQVVVFSTVFITSLLHIDTMISGIVNPEYGAIKDIIDFVK